MSLAAENFRKNHAEIINQNAVNSTAFFFAARYFSANSVIVKKFLKTEKSVVIPKKLHLTL